ncbi:MAG: UPF0182 family protein, partial [Mycobacterium sp.]|nr:UPF0182 family protein [Mycobacterium sp.]
MRNGSNGRIGSNGHTGVADRSPRRPWSRILLLAVVISVMIVGGAAPSYYVDALWFGSLGYASVFWTTLTLQTATFGAFTLVTFLVLYGVFRAVKPARPDKLIGGAIFINRQRVQLPVERVLKLIALGLPLAIAIVTGVAMLAWWRTLALFWHAPSDSSMPDPIFGRPLSFYLFTLPAWQLISGWLLTLALIACLIAILFVVLTGGVRALAERRAGAVQPRIWRGLSLSFAAFLLMLSTRMYLGRFERLFQDNTIFAGVTYTDAHVTLPGTLVVCAALAAGAAMAGIGAFAPPRPRWLAACVVPAAACYLVVALVGGYVSSFIVKPNQLVRERPFIAYNIEMTQGAYALDRIERNPFPADTGIEAVDPAKNQATLENIRLWDWRALQDTLRQIQEIRTYYDFPSIDIDRYRIGGSMRQMMLAARELNVDKLPASSRNWINEKLIYTHGYGVTMNPVNGFTPEGLPTLVLSNMPIQSTIPDLTVTRPEIYFGELTNTDVYVKTRQKEFNYPQGDTNNLTSYESDGGIRLGGLLRRTLIALDRGDASKLPFSDDVTSESRLLMRRNVRERVQALAPFLTIDPDAYIVAEDGRLYWLMDAFTTT